MMRKEGEPSMKQRRLLLAMGIPIALVLATLAWWGVASAGSSAPTVIAYQGRLTDKSDVPINDTLTMTFALYATPEGGTAAWAETHGSITVTDGLFKVYLGDMVPLGSDVLNENPYLGVRVGADSEMTPRQRLGSVPYARTLAPGAVISGTASGPAVTITNTKTGLYATSVDGPALEADLRITGAGSHGFNHTIVATNSSTQGFAAIFGSHGGGWPNQAGPGVYGRSQSGSGVVGEAGHHTPGGPLDDALKLVQRDVGAGVVGYSTIGPGVFAWSTITHSLVVSGTTYVTDDILVAGDVITNADIAESYAAVGPLEAGDVVVLDATRPLGVARAHRPYDTTVAGIISTDAAVVLPGPVDGVPLALVGRVPVKADASYGPVRVGDLLTTSPTAGHAMRCADRLRCVGAVVGKALEPLESGRGVILVLVTLQ